MFICMPAHESKACSAFLLKGDDFQVIGFNENWSYMPGMVLVNKRGVTKYNLGWADMVAAQPTDPAMKWTSKYGSVTFNLVGVDLPCYGMNERGLFVVELFLDKTYSEPDDAKPHMFWVQWIQYLLDNCATTDEVLSHLPNAPVLDWWPRFPGSHFFVADSNGHTAAIEIIDGKMTVSAGDKMPVPILCNGRYQQELAALNQYRAFDGDRDIDYDVPAMRNRFARIAHRLKEYRAQQTPTEFAWRLLDEVNPGVWQLVVDSRRRTLYFRTTACKNIKSINLDQCDFSVETPIDFIDIHANFEGDVVPHLAPWSPEINQAYVLTGYPAGYGDKHFYQSDDFRNVQKNLLRYSAQLQRQTERPANSK